MGKAAGFVSAVLATAVGLAVSSPARAELVSCQTCTVDLGAQGFGNAPRLLTVQANGTESGVIIPVNGQPTIGAGVPDALVFQGNGITNTGGQEVSPLTGDKFSVPTLGSLGYTDASKIGILFNATEPGGNGLNVTDVTLKFYDPNGIFVGAIDGSQNFTSTLTGNGTAGFAFTVSQSEQDMVNMFIAAAGQNGRISLETTITGAGGGPESFLAFNTGIASAVPELSTWGMMILGFAGVGFLAYRRQGQSLRIA